MRKLINKFHLGTIGQASVMLAVFQLVSRLVGLWRDRVLASHFGASDLLDVYYVSFNIPDFVFNLLVTGAVSAAFIPVFIEYQNKKPGEEFPLASNFLNFLFLAVGAASAILFFLAPQIMHLAAPGFSGEKQTWAVLFTRVMFLSPLIFSISVVVGSLLQVYHRFLSYALAPVMYNLGIIFGAVFLVPKFGPLGLAEGVVLGALLHLLVQLPAVWKIGWQWRAVWNWGEQGMKKIFSLTIPRAIGLAGTQLYAVIEDALGTTIGPGSVSVFNLASNLQYLPIALIGISSAVAAFPTLSREALLDGKKEFVARIENYLKKILLLTVPLSFLFFFFRLGVIRIILQAGYFSGSDAALAARVLGFFILGVFSQSLIPFLSRSFYALQNTRTPVLISLGSVGLNTALAFYFVKMTSLGVGGLALAFSLAGIFNMFLLFIFLKKLLAEFNLKSVVFYFIKLLTFSLIFLAILSIIKARFFTT